MLTEKNLTQLLTTAFGQGQPPVFETLYEESWWPTEQDQEDDPDDYVHVRLLRVQGTNGYWRQTEYLLETTCQANGGEVYERQREWLDFNAQARVLRLAMARFDQLRREHPYFNRLRVGAVVMSVGDKPVNIGVGVITAVLDDGGYAIELAEGHTIYRDKDSETMKKLRVIASSIEALFEGMPYALAAYKARRLFSTTQLC
jgi:hypothetical protein